MRAESILVVAVIVEAAIVALAVAAILGRAAWDWRNERKFARLREEARAGLARLVAGDSEGSASVAGLMRALPRDQQLALIFEIGRALVMEDRRPVAELARELSISTWAERSTGSARWAHRLRGARLLTMLGGGEGVLPPLLLDPHPAVRAAAAEWAGDHPSPRVIQRVIALLDDPAAEARFAARDTLVRMGASAVDPLRLRLRWDSNRAARETLLVARGIGDHRFVTAGLTYVTAPDPGTRAIAADLLGAIGGAEAASALTSALRDRDPGPRASAARALGRLQHWRSASAVAPLLGDQAWEVRREAALALMAFDAAGLLLLRRAAASQSFAAEVATLALSAAGQGAGSGVNP